MIVVDASVVVSALVADGPTASTARHRLTISESHHAPHLLDVEVINALRRLVASNAIDGDLALTAHGQLQRLEIHRYPHTPFLSRMWELRHNLSAYDAAYVAIAEAVGAPLLTLDARLASATGTRCEIELLA